MTVPAAARPRHVLAWHALAAACLGHAQALPWILPFLARQRFGATNWQTTVLTAAVPITQFFTIFWHQYYARVPARRYLLLVAATACLPIALIAAARSVWEIMPLFAIAALGGACGTSAISPLAADVLHKSYDPARRGAALGVVTAAQFLAAMLAGLIMGVWSDHDPNAFRVFLPILAAIMLAGVACYGVICRGAAFQSPQPAPLQERISPLTPLREMGRVLRADRRFAGYEAAFMSYGIGWMICTALLPALATDRLHLNYTAFSQATVVAYQLTNVLMLAPAGRLADRIGSMRLAALSFLWLTIFPLGLIYAPSGAWLGALNVLYAIGMVGVQLTWTLGPVSLAGDAAKAPHYLAIHGTLVGVRGVVAQGLGMAIYALTGTFAIPMLIAAGGFAWASSRMQRLALQGK